MRLKFILGLIILTFACRPMESNRVEFSQGAQFRTAEDLKISGIWAQNCQEVQLGNKTFMQMQQINLLIVNRSSDTSSQSQITLDTLGTLPQKKYAPNGLLDTYYKEIR